MKYTNAVKLTNRQISWLITVVICIALGSFGAGYFWGEKKSAERFLQRIGQDSLSDQVYSSICSLYDSNGELEQNTENDTLEIEEYAKEGNNQEAQETIVEAVSKVEYYAQLVGFSTAKHAQQFVERLSKKGIVTHVQERKSRTARGKIINWYQVVTDPYTNRAALISLVEQVKEQERLHDVRIVTV